VKEVVVLKSAAIAAMVLGVGLASCKVTHGPGEVAYSIRDTENVGATGNGAGGTISGSEKVEKEKRGNTPPGSDRDGHGPAAGAIVDPTGAATRGKPY
jgi:hypothetical protein